jgi:hypothetical protein
VAVCPDGTTLTEYPDGTTVLEIPDSKGGGTLTINPDGSWERKDPSGTVIDSGKSLTGDDNNTPRIDTDTSNFGALHITTLRYENKSNDEVNHSGSMLNITDTMGKVHNIPFPEHKQSTSVPNICPPGGDAKLLVTINGPGGLYTPNFSGSSDRIIGHRVGNKVWMGYTSHGTKGSSRVDEIDGAVVEMTCEGAKNFGVKNLCYATGLASDDARFKWWDCHYERNGCTSSGYGGSISCVDIPFTK